MNKIIASTLIAAGLVLGGSAVGVAVSDTSPASSPTESTDETTTTTTVVVAPTTEAPATAPDSLPPVAPEQPETGLALPRVAMPEPGETVVPVPGPYGLVYPDGYVDPAQNDAPPLPPYSPPPPTGNLPSDEGDAR